MTFPSIPAFYFDSGQLRHLADQHRGSFKSAAPFPHIVIDQFLPDEIASLLAREFLSVDQPGWEFHGPGNTSHTGDRGTEKLCISNDSSWAPFTRHFMSQLNSAVFLEFLESLTGIPRLITDPAYRRCGMHSTGRGGRLMVHADSSRHDNFMLNQAINLIFYLNKDWEESYGGHLELWNKSLTRCEKRILPVFNRCVIFETGPETYHGHPQPLACPENMRRNSLALYYYTVCRTTPNNIMILPRNFTDWKPLTLPELIFDMKSRWRELKDSLNPSTIGKNLTPPLIDNGVKLLGDAAKILGIKSKNSLHSLFKKPDSTGQVTRHAKDKTPAPR